MIKRMLLLTAAGFISLTSLYGQVVSLDSCISWAYSSQYFDEELSLIQQSKKSAIESHKGLNLPMLEIDGSATYQNENISIPVAIPGMEAPNVPLNFNRLLVNINQSIYNGSVASKKRTLDSLKYDLKAYEIELTKLTVRARVTGLYGSIILARRQQEILTTQAKNIEARIRQSTSAVESGVMYKSDLLNLKAEYLNVLQKVSEVRFLELGLMDQLRVMTGKTLSEVIELQLPDYTIMNEDISARPEFRLLNSKYDLLDARINLTRVARQPYIGAFASVGVGYPGYDIFNQSVSPMALIGLKLKWQIVDWGATRQKVQILSLDQAQIANERKRVEINLNTQLVKEKREIAKYDSLLLRDEEILRLREQVATQTGARLTGGTATATDYLLQLNAQSVAALDLEIHDIKRKMAKLNYRILQGK